MIKDRQYLSAAEVTEYLGKGEKDKEMMGFLKKFAQISLEDSKKLRKEIENLNIVKIKEENIVKIIDLLPENPSDINKIFQGSNLDENETNKILETIKKFA